ncbi:unnamed protein product [Calicophoron daubneyi]|uniref:Uncharacterized protein n=1 Tax=Calicophoron daubneyi TaxID=300641 RepID=A0AAV2TAB9_CALDB
MTFQYRRDSRPSTDTTTAFQRVPSDYTETPVDQSTRDSLPKYYPKDHEVTRWLVNQMRCRNGLHHLVNLANVQPSLLSAYFELFDQPNLYIDARTGPGMPAYGIKTVLYLTPLAIAIYLRLRSVLRLLLDTSGTRIHARARQEIDVNATCYVRRTKPRPGPFVMDEYSTTHPAIIAVRREFFAGLSLLMGASFHPQAPIGIIERLGTTHETTHWFVDLLDFCVKLLNTRPGVDVIGLLQTISYKSVSENGTSLACSYDPCVYDVKPVITDPEKSEGNGEVWCSVFHRLARKGASRSYSNCGNRLIGLLEHVASAGFFRQKYMPKGPISYDPNVNNRKGSRLVGAKKMNPDMINKLTGSEREAAILGIGADRDACLCLLTLWLERVRNRCLERQAQRLFRLLTTGLSDTGLLRDFLFPPDDIDQTTVIHPYWLSVGLSRNSPKQQTNTQPIAPVDFLDDEANEICELEPPQVNEIRQEVGILGHALGLVDYSEKLYNLGYPRLVEISPISGAIGDAENVVPQPVPNTVTSNAECYKENITSPSQTDSPENYYPPEEFDRKGSGSRASVGTNPALPGTPRRNRGNNNRMFWPTGNRNKSMSPTFLTNSDSTQQPGVKTTTTSSESTRDTNNAASEKPQQPIKDEILVNPDPGADKSVAKTSEKQACSRTALTKSPKPRAREERAVCTEATTNRNGNVWRGKRTGKLRSPENNI